ncbi:maleylpyruvate isomerase family mycothiol-dependent enzyme [Pseudonocardia ailaonensis]|uniref:Maleylpyruvate isomerase family mycothiol-dependent enzyme n=1 Tax=Pseudonocardia ailaonensis TaxID=367279 RepID=A0ABN2NMR4_9PSEU
MDFATHCTQIRTQTELLTALDGADLRAPVPSCPGWTLGALVRHVGGGHRWAAELVRTRATEFLDDEQVRKVDGDDSGPLPVDWLRAGADELVAALREAGPAAKVWVPFRYDSASFFARRFAHETLLHRADACLAAGRAFEAGREIALDAVDEWLELDAIPEHFALTPSKREVLGAGRTLVLQASDSGVSWFVDLTGDVITWRRGSGGAAAGLRAPLTTLLLVLYRRLPLDAAEVTGERPLLELWRSHAAFA